MRLLNMSLRNKRFCFGLCLWSSVLLSVRALLMSCRRAAALSGGMPWCSRFWFLRIWSKMESFLILISLKKLDGME